MAARFGDGAEPIPGYRLIERLGSGGFGEVWKAEAPGGIFKAIKIIFGDMRSKDADATRFAEQELKALKRVKQVRHPYLLALDRYDIVDGRLMIVMELADCNLWDRFRECRKQGMPGIPRDELLGYMAEAAEVLDLMNDQFQLQHLDIKPQNLFLLYNHVKVADFGQVKDLEGVVASVTGGITPVYAAPETFDGFVSRFCDQYALAIVYQELLTGQRPFDGQSMQQLLMQHLQMPPNVNPSPPADRPVLAKALAKKPEDRFPSVTAMVRALRDGASFPAPPSGMPVPSHPSAQSSGRIEVYPTGEPAPAAWAAAPVPPPPVPAAPPPVPVAPAAPAGYGFPPGYSHPPASGYGPAPGYAPAPSGYQPPPGYGPAPAGYQPPPGYGPVPAGYQPPPPVYQPPPTGYGYPSTPPQSGFGSRPADLTPTPRVMETQAPVRIAPPEEAGDGPLRPAVVVGVGFTGLRVLQRFRRQMADRFGPPEKTPAVRLLYLDTDPDALAAAAADPLVPDLAPLPADDVIGARLNRAGHYLKPRLNGRSLTEGWFEPQLLYKLPRNPVTMGLRVFGRLALFDHYRAVMQKVQGEIEAAVEPEAIAITASNTGLPLRTNRPRVYVVAGLGGGTGGGMFLDLAYSVRSRLRRLGYGEPEVTGLLLVPPDGPAATAADLLTQSNTFAALTELNHFSRPETTFQANYDDRPGVVRDPGPPFDRLYLMPGLRAGLNPAPTGSGVVAAASQVRSGAVPAAARASMTLGTPRPPKGQGPAEKDPTAAVAEFLRYDLFTAAGRLADDAAPPPDPDAAGLRVRTFGLTRFAWHRGDVVARTARVVAKAAVNHWVHVDPARARADIPGWAADKWAKLGLDPDQLVSRLRQTVDAAAGGKAEDVVASLTDPLVPKGWLARLPEPERLSLVVDQLVKLFGRPGVGKGGPQGLAEQVISAVVENARQAIVADLPRLVGELIDDPHFRPAGAEEAVRQLMVLLDRYQPDASRKAITQEEVAGAAFDMLIGHVYWQKGMRKLTAQEFTDALRMFPRARYQVVVYRGIADLYKPLKELLLNLLNEVSGCRQRVAAVLPQVVPEIGPPPEVGVRDLLPAGCTSAEDAGQRFLNVLTDDDLRAVDVRVQQSLERAFGGLYQACLNSTDGLAGLVRTIREETRCYLDERLGEVDLAAMFYQKFGPPGPSGQAVARGYQDAEPALVGNGPWARSEVRWLGCPSGAGGDPLRVVARAAVPPDTPEIDLRDEAVVYREFPDVPLAALPQLGPSFAAAYQSAPETHQAPAHARLDVTHWIDVDAM